MSAGRLAGVAARIAFSLAWLLLGPGCIRDPKDVLRFMIWGSREEIGVVKGVLFSLGW